MEICFGIEYRWQAKNYRRYTIKKKQKQNLIVIFAAMLEKDQQNIGDTKYYNIKKYYDT